MVISYFKDLFDDKKFLKKTVAIGIPIAIQALLNTTLNLVDTMMIGTLGQSAIAAVGLANKVFLFLLYYYLVL